MSTVEKEAEEDALAAATQTATECLGALFEPGDWILFRPIETWTECGKKCSKPDYRNACCLKAGGGKVGRTLRTLIDQSDTKLTNLCFGVCPRLGRKGYDLAWQIRTVRTLWADVDDALPEEAIQRCRKAGLPEPTLAICSGNGTHLYWRLDEPFLIDDVGPPPKVEKEFVEKDGKKTCRKYVVLDGEKLYLDERRDLKRLSPKAHQVQNVLAGIAKAIGGDKGTHDLARLLRVPGTLNRKDQRNGKPPKPTWVHVRDPSRRYPFSEFEKFATPTKEAERELKIAAMPLPRPVKRPSRTRLQELDAKIADCRLAEVGHRSEADFALCCYAVREGIPKETVLQEVSSVGKFAEGGEPYFERTWQAAEDRVRSDVYESRRSKSKRRQNASATDDSAKPGGEVLRNYRMEPGPDEEDEVEVGVEAAAIVEDLGRLGGSHLRAVDIGPGGMLFAHKVGEPVSTLERLPDSDSLFAWISRTTGKPADWLRKSHCLTKAEFLKAAPKFVPFHSWLESAPQWPAIPDVYYACGTIEPEASGWLDELVDVFRFDDDLDRCFAKAALLTPFLGVYGEKPLCYVTSPDGQGAGKTQFVETIGYLIGEPVIKFTGGLPKVKEREEAFTNPASFRSRVCLFDNVEKDRTLKSGDIESILTAKTIEGRTLYVGPTSRKNNLAYYLTSNYVQVSRDLAQRLFRVSIRRHPDGIDVGRQAAKLIDAKRDAILKDIAAFFAQKPVDLARGTRWTMWTTEIVARFGERSDAMVERMLSDQHEIDGDAQSGDEIEAAILETLAQKRYDPVVARVHVTHAFLGRVLGLDAATPLDRRKITSVVQASLMGRNAGAGAFRIGEHGELLLDKSRAASEDGKSRMAAGWFYVGSEHDGRRTETVE